MLKNLNMATVSAVLLLLAACAGSGSSHPEFEFDTQRECDTLSLSFDDTGYESFCHVSSSDGWTPGAGTWRISTEAIIANATSSYVTLASSTAMPRSYLEIGSIKDILGDTTWLTGTRNWSDSVSVENFDVWRFEGKWEETEGEFKHCAAFVRPVGYVAGSQGIRQVVYGTYCIDGNDKVSNDLISRFLKSVRY